MLLFTIDSKRIKKDREEKKYWERRRSDKIMMFSMKDWEKKTIEKVKKSWEDRRKKLEEEREGEKIRYVEEEEGREKKKSNQRKKMFWLWDIWTYGL